MAATVGQLLEILAVPELARLYECSIRQMQPAELVRRLKQEKVSTQGHMPELRGRLLRLEALKLHPEMEVPWYPEDFGCVMEKPTTTGEDLLDKFFRVSKYQETRLRKMRSLARTRVMERCSGMEMHEVLAMMNGAMKEYLMDDGKTIERLDSSVVKDKNVKTLGESDYIVDGNQDEESRETTDDESDYIFDENLDEEAQENTNREIESDQSSESIVKIGSDQESFENLDEESTGSWDKDSWWNSSTSSVYRRSMLEVD